MKRLGFTAVVMLLAIINPASAGKAPPESIQAACGLISSLVAPTDVQRVPQMLGINMHDAVTPEPPSPRDLSLGVSASTRFGSDIQAVLIAAFVRREKVLVYYRTNPGEQKNLVCQVQTAPNACSFDLNQVQCL